MKRTLLNMVQGVLSKMDSDEVNSISDTGEAEQIALVFQDAFYDLIEELDLESPGQLINLESATSASQPTRFKIPDNVRRIDWIKYGELVDDEEITGYRYAEVPRKDVKEFNDYVDSRTATDTNVQIVSYGPDEVELLIRNDEFPNCWFSPDDEYIIFDSWDSALESTMIANKTKAFAYVNPTFTITDALIPDLPSNIFPYYYAKVEAYCMATFKQEPNVKSEQKERRLRVRAQRNKWRQGRLLHSGPDFGR